MLTTLTTSPSLIHSQRINAVFQCTLHTPTPHPTIHACRTHGKIVIQQRVEMQSYGSASREAVRLTKMFLLRHLCSAQHHTGTTGRGALHTHPLNPRNLTS